MRLYKVKCAAGVRFAGSKDTASKERTLMLKTSASVRREDVDISEIDVPTDKNGLIGFLNMLIS